MCGVVDARDPEQGVALARAPSANAVVAATLRSWEISWNGPAEADPVSISAL
jgi:hypothetical protein